MKKQVLLIIMDGWGYRADTKYNAIAQAKKPNYDNLWNNFPHALLQASGEAIGLPIGQIGTSEANHLIIGSGRIIYQNLLKINNSIEDKSFYKNPVLLDIFNHVNGNNSSLHIVGMVSPGGVHGHTNHIKALVKSANLNNVKKIILHLFTDGRDVPPKSAIEYVHDMDLFLKENSGIIASIGGRYWGMDRDNNLDRIEKYFKVMTSNANSKFSSAEEVINDAYKNNITDEFIEPSSIKIDNGNVKENDGLIFSNFRSDRGRELVNRFIKENIPNLKCATMTKYGDDINFPVTFPPETINNTLSEILSKNEKHQIRITETEKFTHLTFFFNAQKYEPDKFEDRLMIPSDKSVKTYDEKPQMRVLEIASEVVKAINSQKYDFICTNLVNADMVGHSGNFPTVVKAIEFIDQALGIIIEAANKNNVDVIITADHGNAEDKFNEKINQPITSHSLNPVPFILYSKDYKNITHDRGLLSDIAPTILKILNLPIPPEMSGNSFI